MDAHVLFDSFKCRDAAFVPPVLSASSGFYLQSIRKHLQGVITVLESCCCSCACRTKAECAFINGDTLSHIRVSTALKLLPLRGTGFTSFNTTDQDARLVLRRICLQYYADVNAAASVLGSRRVHALQDGWLCAFWGRDPDLLIGPMQSPSGNVSSVYCRGRSPHVTEMKAQLEMDIQKWASYPLFAAWRLSLYDLMPYLLWSSKQWSRITSVPALLIQISKLLRMDAVTFSKGVLEP
ncbi:hypothetical protein TSMEX_003594 [Taenia solium]|eukprot:TsM_000427800 transcript=TsM_000427800 gene=TsM_000427800